MPSSPPPHQCAWKHAALPSGTSVRSKTNLVGVPRHRYSGHRAPVNCWRAGSWGSGDTAAATKGFALAGHKPSLHIGLGASQSIKAGLTPPRGSRAKLLLKPNSQLKSTRLGGVLESLNLEDLQNKRSFLYLLHTALSRLPLFRIKLSLPGLIFQIQDLCGLVFTFATSLRFFLPSPFLLPGIPLTNQAPGAAPLRSASTSTGRTGSSSPRFEVQLQNGHWVNLPGRLGFLRLKPQVCLLLSV